MYLLPLCASYVVKATPPVMGELHLPQTKLRIVIDKRLSHVAYPYKTLVKSLTMLLQHTPLCATEVMVFMVSPQIQRRNLVTNAALRILMGSAGCYRYALSSAKTNPHITGQTNY